MIYIKITLLYGILKINQFFRSSIYEISRKKKGNLYLREDNILRTSRYWFFSGISKREICLKILDSEVFINVGNGK